jgi:hypothetical protein
VRDGIEIHIYGKLDHINIILRYVASGGKMYTDLTGNEGQILSKK